MSSQHKCDWLLFCFFHAKTNKINFPRHQQHTGGEGQRRRCIVYRTVSKKNVSESTYIVFYVKDETGDSRMYMCNDAPITVTEIESYFSSLRP